MESAGKNFGLGGEKKLGMGGKNFEKFFGVGVEKREGWRHDGIYELKKFFVEGVDKSGMQVYIKQA